MIRVLLSLTVIFLSLFYVYHEYPDVFKNFYNENILMPKAWGKIEIVEEKHAIKSELIWQTIEQFISFTIGVLVCLLIGWKANNYCSVYGKPLEDVLNQCLQKQNRFEKHLEVLERQIITFEKGCYNKTLTLLYNREKEQMPTTKDAFQQIETNESFNKSSQTSKNVNCFSHGEEKFYQNIEETNCEPRPLKPCPSKDLIHSISDKYLILDSDSSSFFENVNESFETGKYESESSDFEKYSGKQSLTFTKEEEAVDSSYVKDDGTNLNGNDVHCEEPYNIQRSYLDNNNEYHCELQHDHYLGETIESLENTMESGADTGECEETFRGKIVPVSQIPQYQGFRKGQESKMKTPRDFENIENTEPVTFISSRKIAEKLVQERANTPLSTPRKCNSTAADGVVNTSTNKNRRRKQRS